VVNTVMMGGDADTNGCIVGALLGAHWGVNSIPAQWISKVQTVTPNRPTEFQANGIGMLGRILIGYDS
jgi:ADP-ribosylglycohydrolase